MDKILDFVKKYNLSDLFLIFLFLMILYPLFYAKQSTYLIDYGREAYVPWQMLQGDVLYKDIFNVYGPLGYQINALAYKFFGVHLNTLYGLGIFNSFFISSLCFLISRVFLNKKISFCVTGVVIAYCIYFVGVHNFVMPYSFNAVYALTAVLFSIYTMLLYLKEKKFCSLVMSFLFAGFSFANKVEYLPYFGFLFLILPFVIEDKKDWKSYFAPICAFFVFPVISFGILILQGASVSDFLNAFGLMKGLLETPAVKYFYNAFGLYFNYYFFIASISYFVKLITKCLIMGVFFYGLNFINYKFVKNKFLKCVLNGFVFVLILFCIRFNIVSFKSSLGLFSWIGMFCAVLVLFYGAGVIAKLHKDKSTEVSLYNKMYLFLGFSSVLMSFKGFFSLSPECYGSLAIAVLIIPVYVFFSDLITNKIKLNKDVWYKTVVNISIVGIFAILCINIDRAISLNTAPISSPKGKIFSTRMMLGQNEFLNYIRTNTPKNSTLVVLPEGAMINFLTERKSHNYYYYLIPVNIQLFDEDKIVDDFKKNPVDYFVIYNLPYTPYNEGTFEEYAPKISSYIKTNYQKELVLNDTLEFVLYKKK